MKVITFATQNERALAQKYAAELGADELFCTGIGPTNVIASFLAQNYPYSTEFINVGYAGGKGFDIGTAVRIGSVSLHHPNAEYKEKTYKLKDDGVHCFSSADFVLASDEKVAVFDMELAFTAAMLAGLGYKPLSAIKIISDNLDYQQYQQTINPNDMAK